MPARPTPVIATLAVLYFVPGLLFLSVDRGTAQCSEPCSSAVLTPPDEPGEALVVTGTVYQGDGTTPAAGVSLYAYHTDAAGLYSETNDNTDPRLKATVVTDAQGRYELRTIKPAPYPGGGVPAHIHYRISGEGMAEQRFDLNFEGDPYLSTRQKERSARLDRFGSIRPLVDDGSGGWKCVYDLRLRP